MTENRDFLAEFETLRVETDGIRNALVSKTAHFNNLVFDNGIFKAIMGELKEIRKDIKVIDEKNDEKLEELKLELKTEIATLKTDFVEQNLTMQQKMDENVSELKNEILKLTEKIDKTAENTIASKNDAKTAPKVPIREAIIGEWTMVGHENFEGFKKLFRYKPIETLSENVKFELVDGKLKRSGAGHGDIIEYEGIGMNLLYVENDHLKTFLASGNTEDYFIENGQLHFVENKYGEAWKRIYEKI